MGAEAKEIEPIARFTTADVNQMLWNRYTDKGEYVLLFDVPNVVGTRQERRCDAVAIGMWGSTGRLIHGFEVKASRADWLREVKDVTKADHFIEQCDRWWLVTADAAIAKPDEIPAAWGWMTATGAGLRIQRPASPLPQHDSQMRRLWAFALIRRAADRGDANSTEFQTALKKATVEIDRRAEEKIKHAVRDHAPRLSKLEADVAEFERASGMKLNDWRLGNVGKLARAIHQIAGRYDGLAKTMDRQVESLQDLIKRMKVVRAACDSPTLEGDDDD